MIYKMFSKLLKLYKINFKSRSYHMARFMRIYFKMI